MTDEEPTPPVVLSYNYLDTADLIGATAASSLQDTSFIIPGLFQLIGEYAYEPKDPNVHLVSPEDLNRNPFCPSGMIAMGSVRYEIEDRRSAVAWVKVFTSGVERLRALGHVLSVTFNRQRWSTYPLKVDDKEYIIDSSLLPGGVQPVKSNNLSPLVVTF